VTRRGWHQAAVALAVAGLVIAAREASAGGVPLGLVAGAAAVLGLLGASTNPRDTGFPQISTAGLFSAMGDPTSFVSRENEHFELYDNFLIDRGAHRLKMVVLDRWLSDRDIIRLKDLGASSHTHVSQRQKSVHSRTTAAFVSLYAWVTASTAASPAATPEWAPAIAPSPTPAAAGASRSCHSRRR